MYQFVRLDFVVMVVVVGREHLGRIFYVPAKISVNLDLLTDMTFCKLNNASFALCYLPSPFLTGISSFLALSFLAVFLHWAGRQPFLGFHRYG